MTAGDVKSAPVPQGKYLPATRHGDLVYTLGMTPRELGILTCEGSVRTIQLRNIRIPSFSHAPTPWQRHVVRSLKMRKSGQVLSLTVFVASDPDFQTHSRLADFASEYLFNELGEAGVGARAAVGVASLPGNASVEIQLIAVVSRHGARTRGPLPSQDRSIINAVF